MSKLAALLGLFNPNLPKGEEGDYILLDYVARHLLPRYKLSDYGRMYLYDKAFIKRFEKVETLPGKKIPEDYYHSLDRKYMLDQLLKLVDKVPGNTAECGVYRGASSFFICERTKAQGRRHRVFDSFEGLPSIDAVDGSYFRRGAFSVSESVPRQTLADFDFVTFHKGWIPDCFQDIGEERFAFVHIDVDLYKPTLGSLRFFYSRMETGGVILCDDSGLAMSCPGARKAMDEFFADKDEPIIEVPTGQSFVIKR